MLQTEQLWDSFHQELHSYVKRRVTDPYCVDDILQDTFLRIHSNIAGLRDASRVRSWIYQILRNSILDCFRSNRFPQETIEEMELEDENASDAFEEATEVNLNREMASGLKQMISELPEKYAQALLLVEFDDVSQTELAKQLGISVSGAKSRVQRGRQILKDRLLQCCHFELDRYGKIIDMVPLCCCCCPK